MSFVKMLMLKDAHEKSTTVKKKKRNKKKKGMKSLSFQVQPQL